MRRRLVNAAAVAAIIGLSILPVSGAGPTFRADYRFTGSSLSAYKPVGQADWKVVNGEIVGTPKDANGGWLLLDGKGFQDTQMYASVKCTAGCKAGFLMRAEKTPDGGMKGVLMSVTENDLVPYMVKIDAQGKEISREALQPGAGRAGGGGGGGRAGGGAAGAGGGRAGGGAAGGAAAAPGAGAAAAPGAGGGGAAASGGGGRAGAGAGGAAGPAGANAAQGGGFRAGAPPAPPAMTPELAAQYPKESHLADRPAGGFVNGDYNTVEVLLSENSVTPKFNGGSLGGGGGAGRVIADADKDGYGQIGLYVGGTGEAHFKDFMYKDALIRHWGPEKSGSNWKAIELDPHYYAWSAAVADFNKDGNMDVVAGAYEYMGPDFSIQRQVYTPHSFNPTAEYPQPAMVNIAYDFTGDGWPDVLSMSGNAGNGIGNLYVNPGNESRLWAHYITIQPVGNEETLFKDIDGDGRPDLIHAGMNTLRYSTFDPKKWDPA
ncbi:MAG TPA: FG-GAP-like repeat-containing protein, partial [Polyangia bacterium]|nr:FG-GAP-like repeat-containing protein [Polyangia bacterium]